MFFSFVLIYCWIFSNNYITVKIFESILCQYLQSFWYSLKWLKKKAGQHIVYQARLILGDYLLTTLCERAEMVCVLLTLHPRCWGRHSPRQLAKEGEWTGPLTLDCGSLTNPLLHFRAIEKLSGHQFENYSFKISYIPDEEVSSPSPPQRAQRGDHSSREQGHAPGGSSQARQIDFPLRILVPTQFVGAIIGKEGLTIKNITKQTQSRYVPPGLPLLPSEGSPECWWVPAIPRLLLLASAVGGCAGWDSGFFKQKY